MTCLFVLAALEDNVFGYNVFEIIPPISSLRRELPNIPDVLKQPLMLICEGHIGKGNTHDGSDHGSSFLSMLPAPRLANSKVASQEVDATKASLTSITCVTVCQSLSLIALGSATGDVILIRGNFRRSDNPIRLKRFVPDASAAITGLVLSGVSPESTAYLFVSTCLSITCYEVRVWADHVQPLQLWQDTSFGAQQYQMSWIQAAHICIVAASDALYSFHPTQGNVSALPLSGRVLSLKPHGRDHMIVTSTESNPEQTVVSRMPAALTVEDLMAPHKPIIRSSSDTPSFIIRVISFSASSRHITCVTELQVEALQVVSALGMIVVFVDDKIPGQNGVVLTPHSLSDTVWDLCRKGFWSWALAQAKGAGPDGKPLAQLVSKLQFYTTIQSHALDTLCAVENMLSAEDDPMQYLGVEDLIHGFLVSENGIGLPGTWERYLDTLVRSLIHIHNRGSASRSHSTLLSELLRLICRRPHKRPLVAMESHHYPTRIAAELARSSKDAVFRITPTVVSGLTEVNTLSTWKIQDANCLVAELALCMGDIPTWVAHEISIDPEYTLRSFKTLCLMDIGVALECLESLFKPCILKHQSLLFEAVSVLHGSLQSSGQPDLGSLSANKPSEVLVNGFRLLIAASQAQFCGAKLDQHGPNTLAEALHRFSEENPAVLESSTSLLSGGTRAKGNRRVMASPPALPKRVEQTGISESLRGRLNEWTTV
eukprot:Blabericola_migrator_1__574@NODE_1141_length_5302_cov_97_735435_g583_i1_p1_GENE_NODE_1141_length_5302_cov_97_735435_g583_i1NODE_1141_length_5302_cov_97_735435_g583_i1_p1_ORF_typecomplete_len823_score156_36_NODE_1141_length_5302_cov_97_735435_g583_i13332471